MKNEHPINFNSEMVRAILDGRKTQTRRVIRLKAPYEDCGWCKETGYEWIDAAELSGYDYRRPCRCRFPNNPYGKVGDRLWVRETWKMCNKYPDQRIEGNVLYYKADMPTDEDWGEWKSSRFMFKKYARLWLEITGIRVERVQEISEENATAEGVMRLTTYRTETPMIDMFRHLWDVLNAKRGYGWEKNPWVWVIEFKQEMPNGK